MAVQLKQDKQAPNNIHTSFLRNDTKPYPLDFPEALSFTTRQSLH